MHSWGKQNTEEFLNSDPLFSGQGQSGFGLIEVLISVVLMGILILALSAGLLTVISTTGDNQVRQRLEASLSSYSDSLKQLPYRSACADSTPAKYDAAYAAWADRWTPPSGVQLDLDPVDGVKYWDESTDTFVNTCPSVDSGAQLLTIAVSDGTKSVRAEVVKRNPEGKP